MYRFGGVVLKPLAQTWSNPEQALQRSLQSYCNTPAAAIQMMNMKTSRASCPQMNHGITLSPGLGPVESSRTITTIKDRTDCGYGENVLEVESTTQTYSSDVIAQLGWYAATDAREVRGLWVPSESDSPREMCADEE